MFMNAMKVWIKMTEKKPHYQRRMHSELGHAPKARNLRLSDLKVGDMTNSA